MALLRGLRVPPRRLVLWHAVSATPMAIVVALGGYLSYHYHALSIQSQERVDRAYEVLDGINGLFVAVEDAEVAQRDFLITGNARNLLAFQAALRATGSWHGRLYTLLLDSRPQLDRLARLDVAIAAKTAELGATVAQRQAQGFDPVREALARNSDEPLMDRVRSDTAEMIVAERQLLLHRQEDGRARQRDILLIGALVAALSVSIRLFTAWFLSRLRKKRVAAAG